MVCHYRCTLRTVLGRYRPSLSTGTASVDRMSLMNWFLELFRICSLLAGHDCAIDQLTVQRLLSLGSSERFYPVRSFTVPGFLNLADWCRTTLNDQVPIKRESTLNSNFLLLRECSLLGIITVFARYVHWGRG